MIDLIIVGDLNNITMGQLRLNKEHLENINNVFVVGECKIFDGALKSKVKEVTSPKARSLLINDCIASGTSQYVAIVSTKLRIKDTNWIKRCINFLNSRPSVCAVGLAGWTHINADSSPVPESYVGASIFADKAKGTVDVISEMKFPVARVAMLNGPFLVFRKFVGIDFNDSNFSIFSEFASLWTNRQGYQSWAMDIGVVNTTLNTGFSEVEKDLLQANSTGVALNVESFGDGSSIRDTDTYN